MTNDLKTVQYYRRRFDLLVFPSFLINLYYFAFLGVVYGFDIITELNYPNGVKSTKYAIVTPFFFQIGLLAVTGLSAYMGTNPSDRSSHPERKSLKFLVICTAFFILTISLPIFFWGGSNKSFFSPILATVSGLTVIVTKSPLLRGIFAGFCIALFSVLSGFYIDIILNPNVVFYKFTGVQVYGLLQTISAILAIIITLRLSWKSDRTIFQDEFQSDSPEAK